MSFLAPQPAIGLPKRALARDHVVILMATRNGAGTIDAQLDSLAAQTHEDWSLIVSDDGSTDNTLARVAAFARRHRGRRVLRLRGPGRGSAMNFLSLLRAAGPAPYVAFADQDDVWLPHRLSRGLAALDAVDAPAVHGGRTIVADATLRPLRLSPAFRRPTGFANALVQNVAGGNTMLLNRPALDLLQPASQGIDRLIAHDWWVYQMVTAHGGHMIYDDEPAVLYRQHGGNQIGANDTLAASLRRAAHLFSGRYAEWCDIHARALQRSRPRMTQEAQQTLGAFLALRDAPPHARPALLRRSGLYRQTTRGTAALWIAALTGRL